MSEYELRLILFSGLPGTGKSTLAEHCGRTLGIPVFAKDRFEAVLFTGGLTDGHGLHSYRLLIDMADRQLSLGVSAILDAVFPLAGFREQARGVAAQYGARLDVIHTFCPDEEIHRQRLAQRDSRVPWTPVGWEEVLRLRAHYEPWSPDAVLFVDCTRPLDQNQSQVLDYLNSLLSE